MALVDDLVGTARAFLRDYPRFFSELQTTTGLAQAYRLTVENVLASDLLVMVDGVPTTDYTLVERDGYVRFDPVLGAGQDLVIEGYYWEWVSDSDLETYCQLALDEFNASEGEGEVFSMTESNTDIRNVIAVAGLVEALWALVTEAARDIDVSSPEVSVPGTQRYRQLLSLVDMWTSELKRRSQMLNIGRSKIEMFTLRRISRTTNRLVPIYKAMEFDDRSYPPERVEPPIDDGVLR